MIIFLVIVAYIVTSTALIGAGSFYFSYKEALGKEIDEDFQIFYNAMAFALPLFPIFMVLTLTVIGVSRSYYTLGAAGTKLANKRIAKKRKIDKELREAELEVERLLK